MMRYCLAATALVMGVCWAMANTAFGLGDTCSNVDITLTNTTAAKIKVTKFEYYDYTDKKWRTEVMFGVDGHQKLERGASWSTTQDLEHVENDNTKFKVTYEADIDGTASGNPVSTTTSEFTCKDNMKKAVILDYLPQRVASLIFFYYGDSEYNTLGQETLKLKKAMEGYDYKVLLKHETLPGWADLSEKDEKLADVKEIPTKANLFKYITQLAKDGYIVDLFIFSHGWSGQFKASKGSHGSTDFVTAEDIKNELQADKTGFTEMPIRMVWGTNCYGQSLGESWRSVGAKATAGARFVNFYPNNYGPFIDDWNKGNVSFDRAVGDSDTNAVRTVAQTFISVADAPAKKKAGKWDGCPSGKFVLGNDPCAKDYFVSVWIAKDEWQAGKSGKENMNYSSYMFLGGDKGITKSTRPVWKP